jgi:uncharacterized membrane protein
MLTEIINWDLSRELIIMIIAALPLAELRGSLPVAINIFQMPWPQALLLSIIGNLIPVPFLLLFLDSLAKLFSRTSRGKIFMDWIYKRTRKQTGIIEKHKHLGLIIFVAIPLPGTGAWTASIAAHLLGIRFGKALLDITLGVIGAGIIVAALALAGWTGAAIAIVGVIVLAAVGIWRQKTIIRRS